jgi:hypothetical protein
MVAHQYGNIEVWRPHSPSAHLPVFHPWEPCTYLDMQALISQAQAKIMDLIDGA